MKKTFQIKGMNCNSCSRLIEDTLKERVNNISANYAREETKIITKTKKFILRKKEPVDYSKLNKDEKILIKSIEEADRTIFQSDLVEKSGFDKVKVSRILDRLEGRQLIERKRRGMTNVVILKN